MNSYKFTCNSCSLAFPTGNDQRQHMKTEWHRYNLKRRVAQLPPISEDLFNSKVAGLGDAISEDEDEERNLSKKEKRRRAKEALLEKKNKLLALARDRIAGRGGLARIDSDGKLVVERKSVANEETKLKQGIEKEEEKIYGKDIHLTEEQLEDKLFEEKVKSKVDIPSDTCIFCNLKSKDLNSNATHMFKKHGLYIPEEKYLIDKLGLIEYLGEKVGFGNVCLYCAYQGKNLESVRQHMIAKGHCKIPYDTEDEKLEISKFYDFSTSYANGTRSDENVEADDNGQNSENDEDVVYASEIGLHLPNGLVAGNRSMSRIWRQNIPPERPLDEGQGTVMAAETRNLAAQYGRAAYKQSKRSWRSEKKAQDMNERRKAKFINVKPHFRDELLQ